MLSDCFQKLEETLLSRVSEVVDQHHEPLVRQNEQRWEELQKKVQELIEAEGASLRRSLDERIQEQETRLLARHAELALACQGEAQDLSRQSAAEVRLRARTVTETSLPPPEDDVRQKAEHPCSAVSSSTTAGCLAGAAVAEEERSAEVTQPLPPVEEARSETPPLAVTVPSPRAGGGSPEAADLQPPPSPRSPKAKVAKSRLQSADKDDMNPKSPSEKLSSDKTRTMPPIPKLQHFDYGPSSALPKKRWSKFFLGLVSVIAFLVLVVLVAFCAYPIITVGMLSMLLLWVLYLGGEEPLIQLVTSKAYAGGRCSKKLVMLVSVLRAMQALRSSDESEQKIKALLFTLFFCFALFNPEVGLGMWLYDTYSPFSVFAIVTFVLVMVFCSALLGQHLRNEWALQRGAARLGLGTPRGSEAVQECMREISSILQESRSWKRTASERRIHEIFSRCDGQVLSELLERMALPGDCELCRIVKYFRDTADKTARSDLLELLCVDRVDHLTVKAKRTLMQTLMVLRLSNFIKQAEEFVQSLLLSTEGDDLSQLKCLQDTEGQIHSMHKLVWEDIKDLQIRGSILKHFLTEGTAQVAHRLLMGSDHFRALMVNGQHQDCFPEQLQFLQDGMANPDGERPGPSYDGQCGHAWRKIMTDMDDTLYCCGGRWPQGIDSRYSKHTAYPGVCAFYRELQGGTGVGQLCALSARPHIVGEVMERPIFDRFEKLVQEGILHALPTVLTGSLDSGARFMMSDGGEEGMRALGEKKFAKFEEYIALYPEFKVVFIGDNGQADYLVGEMMCCKYPQNVEHVWIHQVVPKEKTFGYKQDTESPISFFDDYVMAAMDAATRPSPLVPPQGLKRIVLTTVEDFKRITTWPSESHRESEVERLNQSIVRACAVLLALGEDDSEVELIDAERHLKPMPPAWLQRPDASDAASKLSRFSLARGIAIGTIAVGSKAMALPMSAEGSEGFNAMEANEDKTAVATSDLAVQTEAELPTLQANTEAGEKARPSIMDMARNLVSGGSGTSAIASPPKNVELSPERPPSAGVQAVQAEELPLSLDEASSHLACTEDASTPAEGSTSSPAPAGSAGAGEIGGISLFGLAFDWKSKLSSAASGGKAGTDAGTEGGSSAAADGQGSTAQATPLPRSRAASDEAEASGTTETAQPREAVKEAERTPPTSPGRPTGAARIRDLAGRAAAAFTHSPQVAASAEGLHDVDANEALRMLEEERLHLMRVVAGRDQELEELRGRLALLEGGGTGGPVVSDPLSNTANGIEASSGGTLEHSSPQDTIASAYPAAEYISPLRRRAEGPTAGSESLATAGGSWMSFPDSSDLSEPSAAEPRPFVAEEVVEVVEPVSPVPVAPVMPSELEQKEDLLPSCTTPETTVDISGTSGSGRMPSIFNSITRGLRSRSRTSSPSAVSLPAVQETGSASSSAAGPADAVHTENDSSEAIASGVSEQPVSRGRTALESPVLPTVIESPKSSQVTPDHVACFSEEDRPRVNSATSDTSTVIHNGLHDKDAALPPFPGTAATLHQGDEQRPPGEDELSGSEMKKALKADPSFVSVMDSSESLSPDREQIEDSES